jgi:hypothetical protein
VESGFVEGAIQENVAADPTGASCGDGERCSAFQGRESEGKVRDEHEGRDSERIELIVQKKQVRRAALEDGGTHLCVGTIGESGAKSRSSAF